MNNLTVFQNEQFGNVRTISQNGEPWFVAADVCKVLAHSNPTMAVKGLDDDEKMTLNFAEAKHTDGMTLNFCDPRSTGNRGGAQSIVVINEPGLYQLVIRSNKPEAKAFKRWITHEVIPAIRKHGAYATPEMIDKMLGDPDVMIRTLTALKEERAKNAALTAQAEADKPKVLFADSVSAAQTSILIGELAKLINQNGVSIGQQRLFKWMRDNGYLMKNGASYNLPTQRSMETGLFEIKETTINNPDGSVRLTRTPKVTGKGQVYFINKFLGKES